MLLTPMLIAGAGLLALALGVACALWRRSTIGDLEAANERLARRNEELRELDRAKSDLLADVSHELRTPLTAVSTYVEAAKEGYLGELDAAHAESIEIVERNVRRLRLTIDQLLAYSRIDSGLEVELGPFDLEPTIREVVEELLAAHGPGLLLECDVPPGLPRAYGDAGSVAQVLENLLTNAIKFSPAGSPVTVEARRVPEGIEVAVRDRGIGIAEEDQPKVFDRFFQVDAGARRKLAGSGLGLAIVREVLARHHSEIVLTSRPGEGSTFRFVLPVAVAGRIR